MNPIIERKKLMLLNAKADFDSAVTRNPDFSLKTKKAMFEQFLINWHNEAAAIKDYEDYLEQQEIARERIRDIQRTRRHSRHHNNIGEVA